MKRNRLTICSTMFMVFTFTVSLRTHTEFQFLETQFKKLTVIQFSELE